MPIYEYECKKCGYRFERLQTMKEEPITSCPKCRGEVHRLISASGGFIFKESNRGRASQGKGGTCSIEQSGRTCCGSAQRCEAPPCGDRK